MCKDFTLLCTSSTSQWSCFSQLLHRGQTQNKSCWTNQLVKSELSFNFHVVVVNFLFFLYLPAHSHVGHLCLSMCTHWLPCYHQTVSSRISSLRERERGGEGARRRESFLKGFLHCTTSASGNAQTHPFCTADSNGKRLEIVHYISHTHCREGRDWQVGNPSAQSIDCSLRLVANMKHSIER